jgi:hypothetical protein
VKRALPELIYYIIVYMQITEDQVQTTSPMCVTFLRESVFVQKQKDIIWCRVCVLHP